MVNLIPVSAQVKDIKREVTLYNPYKPTLPEVKKRSFLPDMNDTTKISHDFRYDINTVPFVPAYTISPIRAAALMPDPLPKLYKSFIKVGLGTYLSPLAEISITNERSKKGAIGFYGRHFSTNGKVKLPNDLKVFAGYMDNDASLFGKKFFRESVLEGSVDLMQKTRYAYGYDTSFIGYNPAKKDIRLNYNNIGAKASLKSLTLDSTSISYDFSLYYNFFTNSNKLFQHSAGVSGMMAKSYKNFYVGSGIGYDFYNIPDSLLNTPKYIASVSPFIKKSSDQWSFKLGFKALLDKNMTASPKLNLYPDINFGFTIVPSYINFYAALSGKLEINEPAKVISENPFLMRNGSLFTLPNTDHGLIVSAGLKGNTGMQGNYRISASYSLISDMIFYSNYIFTQNVNDLSLGNYFIPVIEDAELLNIHAEMNGPVNDKLSFTGKANWYNYTLSVDDYAWNKPDWDGTLGVEYNLRDKIIAGLEIFGEGKRRLLVTKNPDIAFETPVFFNLNLTAEYRYTKILSFWTKLNNISGNNYYEWAYYPSHRFLFMIGFTYSL